MHTVILKEGREKSVLRHHPWIFSGAVREVTHLALNNCIGAHGFLVQRRSEFAKLTAATLARTTTVLFRAAFVVGRFLDQVARLAVPTDNCTQSIFAVFDRGHI